MRSTCTERLGRRAAIAGALSLATRSVAAGQVYRPLFRIERNKNANVVQYDAVLRDDALDPKSPIVAYWIMHAEDGRREGLSALDRRAYGFKIVPEREGSCLLHLVATPQRAIRVVHWSGRWVAQIVLAGRSAVLSRTFVYADESAFIPSVRWIDVFGVDMVTGAALRERLKP